MEKGETGLALVFTGRSRGNQPVGSTEWHYLLCPVRRFPAAGNVSNSLPPLSLLFLFFFVLFSSAHSLLHCPLPVWYLSVSLLRADAISKKIPRAINRWRQRWKWNFPVCSTVCITRVADGRITGESFGDPPPVKSFHPSDKSFTEFA